MRTKQLDWTGIGQIMYQFNGTTYDWTDCIPFWKHFAENRNWNSICRTQLKLQFSYACSISIVILESRSLEFKCLYLIWLDLDKIKSATGLDQRMKYLHFACLQLYAKHWQWKWLFCVSCVPCSITLMTIVATFVQRNLCAKSKTKFKEPIIKSRIGLLPAMEVLA